MGPGVLPSRRHADCGRYRSRTCTHECNLYRFPPSQQAKNVLCI